MEAYLIHLDPLVSLALALLLYFLGRWLSVVIPALERYCIPAAVIGGMVFACLNLLGYESKTFYFLCDTSVQIPAMTGFFATVGLTASASSGSAHRMRGSGVFFLLSLLLIAGQNIISVGISLSNELPPALGLLSGSAALVGGHGTVIPIAQILHSKGIQAALSIGPAAATFGIISGGLLG